MHVVGAPPCAIWEGKSSWHAKEERLVCVKQLAHQERAKIEKAIVLILRAHHMLVDVP